MSPSRPRPDTTRTSAPNRGPAAAADNRRALIAATRAIYAEQGPLVPFSAIAKRAGVGQGTLYRHFPDRVALVLAVFDENVDELEQALRDDGTIATLLDRVIDQASVSTAFIRLLSEQQHDPGARALSLRLDRLVGHVLVRDQAVGRIGAHVQTIDVQLAISMLAHELASTPASERVLVAAHARRLFELAFRVTS